MSHHLRRDVKGRRDHFTAHLEPAILLRSTEQREVFIYSAKGRGARHNAEFAPDTVLQTPFAKFAGEGFRMDNRYVLPPTVFSICVIVVSHEEIVEIDQHSGIIYDDGQRYAIKSVLGDFNVHGKAFLWCYCIFVDHVVWMIALFSLSQVF